MSCVSVKQDISINRDGLEEENSLGWCTPHQTLERTKDKVDHIRLLNGLVNISVTMNTENRTKLLQWFVNVRLRAGTMVVAGRHHVIRRADPNARTSKPAWTSRVT